MQEILNDLERLLKILNQARNKLKKLLDEIDNKATKISTATPTDGVIK